MKCIRKRVKLQVINYLHPIAMSSKPHTWDSQVEKLRYTKSLPLQKVVVDNDDWVNFNDLLLIICEFFLKHYGWIFHNWESDSMARRDLICIPYVGSSGSAPSPLEIVQ